MNPEVHSSPNPAPAPTHGEVYWEYFVDAQKAADFLGVDRRTVQRWARQGRIPAHPLNDGKRQDWRFLLSELEDWLEKIIEKAQRFGTNDRECDSQPVTERRWTF